MKTSTLISVSVVLAATLGFSGLAMANCADDAINICNAKHPTPNKSDQAYELYELCIKAQLGQQCPSDATGPSSIKDFATSKKPLRPARSTGVLNQQPVLRAPTTHSGR